MTQLVAGKDYVGPLVEDGGPFVWTDAPSLSSGVLSHYRLAVKDIISVRGRISTCGSPAFASSPVAPIDAAVVSRLRRAAIQIVGGVAMHELAFGVTGINSFQGMPAHPVAIDRIPGGSSSGSAVAVAGSWADVTLCTDSGGSARIPAALCGVIGYKPTYGAISMSGIMPLAPSLDHVGVMARDLRSLASVLRCLGLKIGGSGFDRTAPLRIGVAAGNWSHGDTVVQGAMSMAMHRLGDSGFDLEQTLLPSHGLVHELSTIIMFAEAAATHCHIEPARRELIGEDVRARLELGEKISAVDYLDARARSLTVKRMIDELLERHDVLITPTVSIVAPLVSESGNGDIAASLVSNTRLANLTGHPAMTLPLESTGLPVGLQLIAATDSRLIEAASMISHLLAA